MTREHQNLIKQFIDFKRKTWGYIEETKDCFNKMKIAEQTVAQTYPVYDHRLLCDPKSPFRLYDCLRPTLNEELRIPRELFELNSHREDIKLKIQLRNIELKIKETKAKELSQELAVQRAIVAQQKSEQETIKWHIAFLKDGRNIKQMIEDYDKVCQKLTTLQLKMDKALSDHANEIEEEKLIQIGLRQRISKLHNKVINPLLLEVKVKEELINRLSIEYNLCAKDLKMLNTIVRIPTMCQEF